MKLVGEVVRIQDDTGPQARVVVIVQGDGWSASLKLPRVDLPAELRTFGEHVVIEVTGES